MKSEAVKLQVRMDRALKDEAEAVFAEMGLDTTTAVRVFFTKVAKTRAMPFSLQAEPEFTPAQVERITKAWEESKNPTNLNGPFKTPDSLIAHLNRSADG